MAKEFMPYKDKKLVRSMCEKLSEKFASEAHAGPVDVASFVGILDEEEDARIRQDAFSRDLEAAALMDLRMLDMSMHRKSWSWYFITAEILRRENCSDWKQEIRETLRI